MWVKIGKAQQFPGWLLKLNYEEKKKTSWFQDNQRMPPQTKTSQPHEQMQTSGGGLTGAS